MRKLASIQKIVDVKKHPNADRLDIVTVLGWEIITQINQFKKDDYCVMFQCDSILPQHEVFDFLEKRKYRIRTQKLRGIISQGLVMPISIIKTITGKTIELEEGKDVTELLGVIKHDPQAQKERTMQRKDPKRNPVVNYMLSFAWYRKFHYTYISKQKVKNFPWFIKKTDEERIQNMPWIFKMREGTLCYYTEKLDGQSATYAIYLPKSRVSFLQKIFSNTFYVCSRNINLHKKNNTTWWQIAEQEDVENKLKKVGKNIAIQGEIIGEGVQGNKYNLKGIHFKVFNVYDIDEQRYFNLKEKENFCAEYGFKMVPILGQFTIREDMTVNDMIKMSEGKSVMNNVMREGIVIRSIENDTVSFKAINPKFLLKYGE